MSRLSGIIIRIVLAVVALAVLLAVGLIVAVSVSPRPFAWLVQKDAEIEAWQVIPPSYDELSQNVRAEKDIEYPSHFKSNGLDVFIPKNATGPAPTIFWIHGGGFVAGDKADIATWATMIAARGYIVVSINYELAPGTHYPSPIVQLGETYKFLKSSRQRFPAIDLHRLVIGGDSAGAQIASQFIAMQNSAELARSMQLPAALPKEDIVGAILYCGLYDLRGLCDSGSWLRRFYVRHYGWAYFGIRDWRDTAQAMQASTVEHITSDYPPSFITDGNTMSFEDDARNLEAKLKENGVYVDSLYYPVEHARIEHDYQFDFSIPEWTECYNRTLAFLGRVTASK